MNLLSKLFLKKIIFKRIREVDVIIFGHDKFNFDSDIKFAYFKNSEINLRYLIPDFVMYLNKFFTKKKNVNYRYIFCCLTKKL